MGQLGKRIGVSAPGVAKLESRDSSGSISVARLRSAAEALGCDLLIAFVPRMPLTDMVQQQAALKAKQENSRLIHTMKLEDQDQGVAQPADLARSIDKRIAKRGSRLWD
jgi:predicted DNA-binding mobile mystery protein A